MRWAVYARLRETNCFCATEREYLNISRLEIYTTGDETSVTFVSSLVSISLASYCQLVLRRCGQRGLCCWSVLPAVQCGDPQPGTAWSGCLPPNIARAACPPCQPHRNQCRPVRSGASSSRAARASQPSTTVLPLLPPRPTAKPQIPQVIPQPSPPLVPFLPSCYSSPISKFSILQLCKPQ